MRTLQHYLHEILTHFFGNVSFLGKEYQALEMAQVQYNTAYWSGGPKALIYESANGLHGLIPGGGFY